MMEIIYFEKIKFSQQCKKSFHFLAEGRQGNSTHVFQTHDDDGDGTELKWWWNETERAEEEWEKKIHKWIWVEKFYEKFCKINFQNNFHTFL